MLARTAAALTSVAVGLGGALVLTGSPAQAVTQTDYGFQTLAFGTRVSAQQVGFRSAKTAFTWESCTRLTGLRRDSAVAAADAPGNNPSLKIGAVASRSATYRKKTKGIVGTRSTDKIASVTLGPSDGPHLTIQGLRTTADAWATRNGALHAAGSYGSTDISSATGNDQLDSVLNQPGAGIGTLFGQIRQAAGDTLVVPGLGEISMGGKVIRKGTRFADVKATALTVLLYGPDTVKGGGDDSVATIGRSRARINKDLPAGLFHGRATASDATLLDGSGHSILADHPLGCMGTYGRVVDGSTAALDLGNAGAVQVGATSWRVFGVQRRDGRARGWTESSVADIALGGASGLRITGIVGRANVQQLRSGRVRVDTSGSTIGALYVQGKRQAVPDPGQTIEVPGVAKVQFFVKDRRKRVISVTAVRITLLDQSPGVSVIDLGYAKAGIRRN